jgi:peptidoglycan hydrolase CwlO-like protein
MTQLFIQLAQSVTGAVITIVALLLVAAIIGYVSAWFYAKSVYTPVIKGLEADKEELNRQISGLKSDITKLNSSVEKLNEKISSLEKEITEKEKEIKNLRKIEKLP